MTLKETIDKQIPHLNKVYNEDCLVGMQSIKDRSIDLILCDLPYGTTNCSWDSIIPLDLLWESYNRIIKPNGAIVLTASQPFTSQLIGSNFKNFKYCWVWEKSKATNYLNSKKQPLRSHEDVCVFYKEPPIYNAQKTKGEPYDKGKALRETPVYGAQTAQHVKSESGDRWPRSIIYFPTAESEPKSESEVIHPTQKPIELMMYFVETYTDKGEVVLDNCMGSGSTAIACIYTKRNFIGFEWNNKDNEYYKPCVERIKDAQGLLF